MWDPIEPGDWRTSKRTDLDSVQGSVASIINRVKEGGDQALVDITSELDRMTLEDIRIPEEELLQAYDQVDPIVVKALNDSYYRISRFHREQLPSPSWYCDSGPGIVLGMKSEPLDSVGAYIPGGRAAYPSTVLMATIPARVAGVSRICCCTPPPVNPITKVALHIAGVREAYSLGGAQAIAAMALGTETISPVRKIVGPGNIYVTAAKIMLSDHVDIDFPAGPSEIVILADKTSNPEFIAADILAQAEHDPMASCALVTLDLDLPGKVWDTLEKRLVNAPRREIMEKALENAGYTVVDDLESGIEACNLMAPEHLSLQVDDPWSIVDRMRNAGAIFLGGYSAVACGDYASGTNHILPTAGYPSIRSGLDVNHFLRRTSIQMISREGLDHIGKTVMTLARAEGLHEHARSIEVRERD